MADIKRFVDIDLNGNKVINFKTDTLDITSNLASANTKRIVYWSGQYYYSDGTSWIALRSAAANGLPAGGTTGQILAKASNTDYDSEWIENYTSTVKHEVKLAENISIGQAAYVSSANGTNMLVSKASNDTEATSSKTMGLIASTGVTNDIVFLITEGLLAGLDTSTATAGDPVWLGTSGNLIFGLVNKPVAPAHLVFIGIVTRAQSNNGEIFVKVQNGYELNEIHDVLISNPLTDQILKRDSDGLWKNHTLNISDTGLNITTIGTSGAATLIGNTLNIPTYEISLIPKMSGNEIWRGSTFRNNSTTIDTTAGITLSTSGTNTARSVGTTSYATRGIRMGVTASIVATGRYSGMRGSALLWYVTGGFLYTGEFNISDTATATGTHNFWGLASSTSDLAIGDISNNQPSALLNIIAFANDSGDANLQIMHNDASGTATKTDLGSSFPSNRTAGAAITTIYSCYLYNAPNSSDVIYRIVNKETGAVAQGTLSTNLPASTVGLNFFGVRTMGTSGGGITNSGQFDVYRLGVYSL